MLVSVLIIITSLVKTMKSNNQHNTKTVLSILIAMIVIAPTLSVGFQSSNSLSTLTINQVQSPLTTISTTNTITNTVNTTSLDYQLWVQPYLKQLEKIREVLMTPYTLGNQHYGYDSTFGLIRGGNIESSPAINVGAGYNDVIVAIDNNLEGAYSLDYANSLVGISTNIYTNVRVLLNNVWNGIGACSKPFIQYSYPSSFSLLDMRESEYGFISPYISILETSGNHLGGIGSNCTTQGQTWYLPNYENPNTSPLQPLIVTELPSNSPIGSTGDLESLSFYIDQAYIQCIFGSTSCNVWQNAYLNAMSQYPFSAPREALHFIQATRATKAWTLSNMTYNGMNSTIMLNDTINQVFTQVVGIDGGLCQNFGSCTNQDNTPEPNLQAMIAFDSRMPNWFVKPLLVN